MIRTPGDPLVEGYEFRYLVIEVNGVMPRLSPGVPERVFKGPDSREFRTIKGAEAYAARLMRRGRGQPVVIQTGKLSWFTAAGVQEEGDRISPTGEADDGSWSVGGAA